MKKIEFLKILQNEPCEAGLLAFLEDETQNVRDYFLHHRRGGSDAAWCLKYIDFDSTIFTADVCLLAVTKNQGVIQYIPDAAKTVDICRAAVDAYGWALAHVPENLKTAEICFSAVKKNGVWLKIVPENLKTVKMCTAAVESNFWAINYVPKNLKPMIQ